MLDLYLMNDAYFDSKIKQIVNTGSRNANEKYLKL